MEPVVFGSLGPRGEIIEDEPGASAMDGLKFRIGLHMTHR
jgi:hypothetical protein